MSSYARSPSFRCHYGEHAYDNNNNNSNDNDNSNNNNNNDNNINHRSSVWRWAAGGHGRVSTIANLRTNIVDFRGFDSSTILMFKGWNSQAHRGVPGKFESSNVSREIERTQIQGRCGARQPLYRLVIQITTVHTVV